MAAKHIFVLDNGGFNIKAGFANNSEPRVMPNAVMKAKSERRRPFIGDQLDECRDVSGLYYILPVQKGYLINWDTQKDVWDYLMGKDCFNVHINSMSLVLTQPYLNFQSVQEGLSEYWFEEMECESFLTINPGTLSAYKYGKENPSELCCLVVDCGYSFTHLIPYVQGKKITEFVHRIEIGGKMLTNHLKDIISYRQLNVMDETYVINQLKEDTCFVSTDFNGDMAIAQKKGKDNPYVVDYVLPDFTTIRRGYVRPKDEAGSGEQVIRMNNERFAVPELLFHPSDIGIQQMGISEAIVYVIEQFPSEVQYHLYKNVLLIGGSCSLPNFKERVEKDVRTMAPAECEVRINLASNPVTDAWRGGCVLTKDPQFSSQLVTRREYEEHGFSLCLQRFDV
ncbi:actin-related protein 6 [Daphnia magna]|uniref:Uncharacterized protein n=2 Tax=Daphnia magna TaxID=35525 RepID=A0ABR0ALM9_9CRUS|nr:actin-related protein 6 [Daphnia magna]KAK4026015.1 hypothetical protein OUZ56_015044 [Daphnia magna]KZS12226.1 Actin-related protein [Daphnia magna]